MFTSLWDPVFWVSYEFSWLFLGCAWILISSWEQWICASFFSRGTYFCFDFQVQFQVSSTIAVVKGEQVRDSSSYYWCELSVFQWVKCNCGGGRKGFISIFPGSQCVPTMFLLSSKHVSQVLNVFCIALHFYPMCIGKCCPPFTYIIYTSK